ncbi:CaiB/BaiF CoA transferase family protein [Paeniglutamicibacter sp. NPDC091659]|uniref:CaiB/BaiF CoA transferase family protein n=1 Tax=Paeniglutamicibacter sp. NPDC091659 TaxID=3364389 RepID=UPI00381E109B
MPLNGIRVIDLSRALAGPYCTALLADMGAEVIKIETTSGGDSSRAWPPFQGDHSLYFDSTNRNKKSISVDLYSEEGRDLLDRLLADADALVENFKPGTMEKMGLGPDRLREINPRLVVSSITGYGAAGPWKDRAGLDQVIQAASGLTSVTGKNAEETYRVGIPLVDIATGMAAAFALVSALYSRLNGNGAARVSTSLFETALGLSAFQGQTALSLNRAPVPQGNNHPTIAPYGAYATATENIVVAVGTEAQWKVFCSILDRPELFNDPRFGTSRDRAINRDELNECILEVLVERPASEWIETINAVGIPCGPVLDYLKAVNSEQAQALKLIAETQRADGSRLRLLRGPISVDNEPTPVRQAPPALGEHSREILDSMGLSAEQIDLLVIEGIVREPKALSQSGVAAR